MKVQEERGDSLLEGCRLDAYLPAVDVDIIESLDGQLGVFRTLHEHQSIPSPEVRVGGVLDVNYNVACVEVAELLLLKDFEDIIHIDLVVKSAQLNSQVCVILL